MQAQEPRLEIDLRARERRLYDRLRERVIRHEPGDRSGLRDLILVLPDLLVLAFRLMRDARVPIGTKVLAGMGLGYALLPIDLLPELLLGPIGLVDDALAVAWALSQLLNHVHPDLVRAHWSGRGDALDAARRLTGWAEDLLGRGVARALGFRSPS